MKLCSILQDERIDAHNVLFEMSIAEYEILTKDIVGKNEFQRKRVRSSKTVYALLREDLLKNCVIPPVVLALTSDVDFDPNNEEMLFAHLNENKEKLVILDGLQRTHTILGLLSDLRSGDQAEHLAKFIDSRVRVEIYVGLNRLGILYRMLTLNTGQTPMSLRQQIEILYLDYADVPLLDSDVSLIRESDSTIAIGPNQYNFKDVIEGFKAYLDRDPLPIDKADLLENINSLEKLSKEDQNSKLFEKFVLSLHKMQLKFLELTNSIEISSDYAREKGVPFGKNSIQIFKKPQAISGFGAAIGKLLDFDVIGEMDDIVGVVEDMEIEEPQQFLEDVNDSLLWLKENSTKIGNAQRSYFTFFYRDLLNSDSDAYQDPLAACKSALRKYQSQNM